MIYVGRDADNDPTYLGSGSELKWAILYNGVENFKREVIEYCTRENICEREIHWIAKLEACNPLIGYNILPGGEGFPMGHRFNVGRVMSERTRLKIGCANKGRVKTEEEKNRIAAKLTGRYGRVHSCDTRRRMSQAKLGRHFSSETRSRMAEAHTGNKSNWYGLHHSEATKSKMRDAMARYWKNKREQQTGVL